MVYGDKSTHASNELRKLFFKLNFKQNKESIENVKKIYIPSCKTIKPFPHRKCKHYLHQQRRPQ